MSDTVYTISGLIVYSRLGVFQVSALPPPLTTSLPVPALAMSKHDLHNGLASHNPQRSEHML